MSNEQESDYDRNLKVQKLKRIRLLILLVAFGFMYGGYSFASVGVQELWRGWGSESWPTVQGQVVSSEVDFSKVDDEIPANDMNRNQVKDRVNYEVWYPVVKYSYSVDGQTHESEQIAIVGETFNTRDEARTEADQYPEGSELTVYYDPANPADAVLKPGADITSGVWILFGGLLFLTGVAAAVIIVIWIRDASAEIMESDDPPPETSTET